MSGLLINGVIFYLVWISARHNLALGIAVGTIACTYISVLAIAGASDAIFDSLHERINAQSLWLEVRLDAIEEMISGKVQTESGRERWRKYQMYREVLDEAYFSWPERKADETN